VLSGIVTVPSLARTESPVTTLNVPESEPSPINISVSSTPVIVVSNVFVSGEEAPPSEVQTSPVPVSKTQYLVSIIPP